MEKRVVAKLVNKIPRDGDNLNWKTRNCVPSICVSMQLGRVEGVGSIFGRVCDTAFQILSFLLSTFVKLDVPHLLS